MNKTEKNKVTMYYAVNAVLTSHQQTIDSFAPLVNAVTSFRTNLNEILERAQEFAGTIGATAAKNNALDDMVERTNHMSNALYTLGRRTNNEEIKGVSKLSLSDIYRLRENELVQYCTRVFTFAQANAESLVQYTITPDMITALGQSIDTYRHHADSKDTRFAGSKAAREVLSNLFANADELLNEDIDIMIELVKNNNTDFYNQYKAARTIKDIGGSPKAKAKVSEAIVIDNTRVPSTAQ